MFWVYGSFWGAELRSGRAFVYAGCSEAICAECGGLRRHSELPAIICRAQTGYWRSQWQSLSSVQPTDLLPHLWLACPSLLSLWGFRSEAPLLHCQGSSLAPFPSEMAMPAPSDLQVSTLECRSAFTHPLWAWGRWGYHGSSSCCFPSLHKIAVL